ncbi:glutamate racemase [Filimonas lacunae]|uniref:Glutamate racemase n=1 Tax=Filimonas lacunae TaxID=477680 RepID=A0A173MRC1_9BACT|nr:glutamate racemase [Filimonas lacunae]BAV09888.1 glutamate racemase [Filimonas lacunae]SIS80540.1 glutamate racemase [Filimonas lacunae]
MQQPLQPIGVFDSGYGGLTVLKEIVKKLPQYDYIYMGDNSRAPYGSRSFETVYHYTLQCVEWFFKQGCPLVILACNTASAKALRSIQKINLPEMAPDRRVLGVIRPTSEVLGNYTKTGKVGILATNGTVQSQSYLLEIEKFFPDVQVQQQACPVWVPLIENNEYDNAGADFFIEKYINQLLAKQEDIDTVLLACTHYPLIKDKISRYLPEGTQVLAQGEIVANSLEDYLQRHPEMETRITRNGNRAFYTTDDPADFDAAASLFYGHSVTSGHVSL